LFKERSIVDLIGELTEVNKTNKFMATSTNIMFNVLLDNVLSFDSH